MRRTLLLILLLLSLPAQADMYQDARNATQPQALQNLTNQILTISGGVLQAGTGSETPLYGTGVPSVLDIAKGTDAAPVTAAGQQIRILYRHGVTKDKCFDNPADTGCVSPILVNAIGSAATSMVTSGITSYAMGSSPTARSDVQALNGIGDVMDNAVGIGTGAYLVGRMRTTAGTGRALGAEISAANYSGFNTCALASTGLARCVGIWLVARSTSVSTPLDSALQIGTDASVGGFGSWKQAITINNNAIFNTPNTGTKSFADYSTSEISLNVEGAHKYALVTDTDGGLIGLGTLTPEARLHLAGGFQHSTWASLGIALRVEGATYTDTTSSGAVGYSAAVSAFLTPTIAATNPTTYTSTSTVYIANCPVSGTNVTSLSCQSLTVGGNVYFNDRLEVKGDLVVDGTITGAGAGAFNGTAPRVVYYGDSLTNGNYDKYVVLSKYKTGFTASGPTVIQKDFTTVTSGYGGLMASTGLTYAPEFLDPYYQTRAPLNIALIWLGTNDIALDAATPAATWTRIQTLAAAAKAKGFKVCVGTSISRVSNDTNLTTLNGLIVGGWAAAGISCLVNFASDPNLAPNGTNYSNLTYYSSDQIHLNEAGKGLAAAVAQAALNTYIATFTGPTPAVFNAPGGMVASALPTSAGGGGLYMCVDSTGVMYKKATCP